MADPVVSVGMPVYNGERFLHQAVDTLLNQDFENFELLISDNASTDGTEEICREYAAKDKRVHYERHDRNRGASYNYNRLLDLAHPGARYLKWAACDDEHGPKYLSRTVEMLEADPSAASAHTGTADIDEEGYVLKVWHQPYSDLASFDVADRVRNLVTLRHECFDAFALIRADVCRATRGLGEFSDADNVLLVEIALRGRMIHDDETMFYRRQHADRSMAAFVHARRRIAWFNPDKADTLTFPTWRVGREFVSAIHHAPLSAEDKRRCYAALSAYVENNWQNMTKNVIRSAVEAPAVIRSRRAKRSPAGT